MKRQRSQSADHYLLYNEATEPIMSSITTPVPRFALPRESWLLRAFRALAAFLSFVIKKINQLLALALATLLLLLFTRFILNFFHFSSVDGSFSFSYWVLVLSAPLVVPFQNITSLPYNGYTIDVSTLIAILVYAIGITIVRQFLKILVAK